MAYLESLIRNVTGNPPGARPRRNLWICLGGRLLLFPCDGNRRRADVPFSLPESYLNALGKALTNSVSKSLASRAVMKAGVMQPPDSEPIDFTALFDSGDRYTI